MDNQDSAGSKFDLIEEVISLRGKIARLERSIRDQGAESGGASTAIEAWNRCDPSALGIAAERTRILGRVAGTVLHDLNNIFTVILGNVDLLRDPTATEDLQGGLEEIEASVAAGAVLTRRWLGICGRTSPDAASFDPDAALHALERPLALVTEAPVEVATGGSGRPVRTRVMSRERFEHAVLTLALLNAEASQPGASVLVHASVVEREDGSFYAIRIESHGSVRPEGSNIDSSREHEVETLVRWARSLGGTLAEESPSQTHRGFVLHVPLR